MRPLGLLRGQKLCFCHVPKDSISCHWNFWICTTCEIFLPSPVFQGAIMPWVDRHYGLWVLKVKGIVKESKSKSHSWANSMVYLDFLNSRVLAPNTILGGLGLQLLRARLRFPGQRLSLAHSKGSTNCSPLDQWSVLALQLCRWGIPTKMESSETSEAFIRRKKYSPCG